MIVVKMHVSKSSQKCSIQVKTISLELAETRGPLLSLSLSLALCALPNNSYSEVHSTRVGSSELSPLREAMLDHSWHKHQWK
jgi:hypothetical protein